MRPGTVVAALGLKLPLTELPADDVRVGSPRAGSVQLGVMAGAEVGVWEMTAGVARDTEEDEILVVLSGRATVQIDGGATVELKAGDVMRLESGSRTTWTVHEPLRKVYITPTQSQE
ncbi:MAG TPA: cupin domain-containing protein [Actinomycetales bacterium]|nr:cupin domain-containing protein [Actinomycetales bacterium]